MMNRGRKNFGAEWHAWAALLGAALVAGCGGGGGDSGVQPAPNEARLDVPQSGGLVAFFKAKIAERAASGLNGTAITVPTVGGVTTAGSVVANSGASLVEPAVEEDNLIKSEGTMVYALHRAYPIANGTEPARLAALSRLADGSLKSVGRSTLDAQYIPSGLYLTGGGTRVAVLSQQDPYYGRQTVNPQLVPEFSRKLSLDMFTVSQTAAPAQIHRMRIDGLLVGSRMIGNTLYVVSTWSPDLTRFVVPAGSSAAAANTALAGLDTAALLPTVQFNDAPAQPLVAEANCLVHPGNASLALQITTITAIDLSSANLARNSRCFAGGSEGLYMAPANIYVASSRQYRYGSDVPGAVFPATSRTDIHKFALQSGAIDYRASTSVTGHLGWDAGKMPFRMSEYQGDLRVLTFTGTTGQSGTPPVTIQSKPASPAVLTVLRENTSERSLNAIATLPNTQRPTQIGRAGQQIDMVHFAGPRAYATSLTRLDPMVVLDLSNAANPQIAGEVDATGYSDHVYPMPNGLLLGIGNDASVGGSADGIQVALFDVGNPAQSRRIAAGTLGERGSLTTLGSSRQALNIVQSGQRVRVSFGARVYEAVPGTVPAARGYQGAARFEVDTGVGKLTALPSLSTVNIGDDIAELQTRYNLANERGLQTDTALYHLSGGQTFYLVGN